MGSLTGYARVSTAEQSVDLQTDELTGAGCLKVFVEHMSGGRSLRHLIDVVTALDERGVGFRSLRESIDTTTSGGRLVFHLFGALAQFEREIIRDRTQAGLASARTRGRVGGRPPKQSAD